MRRSQDRDGHGGCVDAHAERRAALQPPSALAPAPEAHHAAHHLRRLLRRLRLCLGRLRLRENFGAPCRGSTLYCTASAGVRYSILPQLKRRFRAAFSSPKCRQRLTPVFLSPTRTIRAHSSNANRVPAPAHNSLACTRRLAWILRACAPLSPPPLASQIAPQYRARHDAPVAATCPHRSLARLRPLRPNSPPRFFSHPLSPVVPRQMAGNIDRRVDFYTHGFVFENENKEVCLPAGA